MTSGRRSIALLIWLRPAKVTPNIWRKLWHALRKCACQFPKRVPAESQEGLLLLGATFLGESQMNGDGVAVLDVLDLIGREMQIKGGPALGLQGKRSLLVIKLADGPGHIVFTHDPGRVFVSKRRTLRKSSLASSIQQVEIPSS